MRILALSGFIPEQICDVVRFTQYEGNRSISHYCGYASDFISQVLNDRTIDGAVYPKSCDSSRVITSYLMECGKFLYQMPVLSGTGNGAVAYLASSIEKYKTGLEAFYKVSITDIDDRIIRINERNKKLKELYGQLGGSVVYSRYLTAIHKMLVEPLERQCIPELAGEAPVKGKRVYIVGSFLSNHRILEAIENAGMCIIGDNLPESKRLAFSHEVHTGGNVYENIAAGMLENLPSPTQNCFMRMMRDDLEEIREKEAEGVIFINQKYCEPYDYLYYVYKEKLDRMRIPVLKISMTGSTENQNLEFALEAFSDLI